MLFPTAPFAFLFLPIVSICFFLLGRAPRAAAVWLGLASLFFYGYWIPQYIWLLILSICFNFLAGIAIGRYRDDERRSITSRLLLIVALTFNLGLLSYYKYANFLLESIDSISGLQLSAANVTLPIGISFFTFTQIAFLVDVYRTGTREYRFIHYLLFVTYFPHLVAGPILHHAQMIPQFSNPQLYRPDPIKIAAGLGLATIGMFKKVVFADSIAPFADSVFDAVAAGQSPTFEEAWLGSLAYTFQLYFDFSGYSDMAVGISMILGVSLPFNFASPYRAANISEFWRRWHMTLSAFLRDYLYIPLGGNRLGNLRRLGNLMTTMLLGGLWHGASWTFVAWGGLHGLYLGVHHTLGRRVSNLLTRVLPQRVIRLLGWGFTVFAVVIAWVFFRAADFPTAGRMIGSMFTHAAGDMPRILWNAGLDPTRGTWLILFCAAIAIFPANSNRIFEQHLRTCRRSGPLAWSTLGASAIVMAMLILISGLRSGTSPFIYFNF